MTSSYRIESSGLTYPANVPSHSARKLVDPVVLLSILDSLSFHYMNLSLRADF